MPKAVLLALVVVAAIPCQATTIFTDGTFSLANYSQVTYNNDPVDVTISVAQTASGNPGTAIQVLNTWSALNITFTTTVGLLNTTFLYNPSTQGTIQSLGFSVDRYITLVGGTLGATNNAALLLSQNGNYYFDTLVGPALIAGQFQTVSGAGILASDFQLYDFVTGTADPSQHPNFSATGGVIDFGMRVNFGHINALPQGGTLDVRQDNLAITLTTIPEPNTMALLAAGAVLMLALAFLRLPIRPY